MSDWEEQSASCRICSRPALGETSHCSVSCALASKIPLGDGGPLPATGPLGWAGGLGFALFNQLLMASMAWVTRAQVDDSLETRFAVISMVIGVFWLTVVAVLWGRENPKRKRDCATVFTAFAAGFCLYLYQGGLLGLSIAFFAFNLLISFNLARGLLVLWRTSKKREK